MATKEELEQKRLALLKKAQDIQAEIKRKEKIEKEKARKKDTHDKIVMGGALLKALGKYLDETECDYLVECLTKPLADGNTLADKINKYIADKSTQNV